MDNIWIIYYYYLPLLYYDLKLKFTAYFLCQINQLNQLNQINQK
jgi:hypothetical protein